MSATARLEKPRAREMQQGARTQLDDVSHCAHHKKSDADCLRDLDELAFIGCCEVSVLISAKAPHIPLGILTLRALVDEEGALADKILWNIDELLDLVGHLEG